MDNFWIFPYFNKIYSTFMTFVERRRFVSPKNKLKTLYFNISKKRPVLHVLTHCEVLVWWMVKAVFRAARFQSFCGFKVFGVFKVLGACKTSRFHTISLAPMLATSFTVIFTPQLTATSTRKFIIFPPQRPLFHFSPRFGLNHKSFSPAVLSLDLSPQTSCHRA